MPRTDLAGFAQNILPPTEPSSVRIRRRAGHATQPPLAKSKKQSKRGSADARSALCRMKPTSTRGPDHNAISVICGPRVVKPSGMSDLPLGPGKALVKVGATLWSPSAAPYGAVIACGVGSTTASTSTLELAHVC
ncbi:unnamed protein product [Cutaneotrichosporon oleaginosum]